MKAALYARISTSDHGQDITLQLDDLRQFCRRKGWEIADEYADLGISGAKTSRPELNRLLSDAKRRKFDAVVVWRLDRFGRSLAHLVTSLAEFDALKIAFVSLHESLDLSTPAGRLQFGIISCMAEYERSLIAERVRAGMAHAKGKGKHVGRPHVRASADEVKTLRAQGFGMSDIAAQLGISQRTAYNLLQA